MTREIRARGICRFHFWGSYYQTYTLEFDSEEDAVDALPVLRQVTPEGEGWRRIENFCGVFTSDAEKVDAQLEGYGADSQKMGSLRLSCDCGEPFDVVIPVPVSDHTLPLFAEIQL